MTPEDMSRDPRMRAAWITFRRDPYSLIEVEIKALIYQTEQALPYLDCMSPGLPMDAWSPHAIATSDLLMLSHLLRMVEKIGG